MKNKIYLVSFEYFPISQGGLARHAKALIDRLLRYEVYKAIIATPKNNKIKLQKDIIAIPCTYVDNKYLCYLEFSWKLYFLFKKKFKKDKFLFFSSFSYLFNPFLPKSFYIFVHSNQKRVYFTKYDEESMKEMLLRKFTYYFNYHWEVYLCRKAKKIFSVSPSVKEDTYQQYDIDKSKIIIVTNGLDTELFKKKLPRKYHKKNLLFVGKLFPRKNIVYLINIFKLLIDKDSEFNLHIMGNGHFKYINKLKLIINTLKLSNKIFIHRYISDYALNKLYEKSDLFVFTSLVEGLPLVLLEAMSKGLPILAYNVIGVRDVVINKKSGFLIKVGDIENFVKKILFFYKNKRAYQEFSENALRRLNDFSWDKSVIILHESLKK